MTNSAGLIGLCVPKAVDPAWLAPAFDPYCRLANPVVCKSKWLSGNPDKCTSAKAYLVFGVARLQVVADKF